jgi:hypothetical protein
MSEPISLEVERNKREIGAILDEMNNGIRGKIADAYEQMDRLHIPVDNIETLLADAALHFVAEAFPHLAN